jgi:hypothetical protein
MKRNTFIDCFLSLSNKTVSLEVSSIVRFFIISHSMPHIEDFSLFVEFGAKKKAFILKKRSRKFIVSSCSVESMIETGFGVFLLSLVVVVRKKNLFICGNENSKT